MLEPNSLLYKASHFNEAMLNQLQIVVYQQNEPLDNGGLIEKHTKEIVKISGCFL